MWENYVSPQKNCTLCFFIHSLQKYNHFSNVCMKVYERFCKRTSRHFTFPFLKRFNDRFLMVCLSWFFQKIVLYVLFNHTVEKYNYFSKWMILCSNNFVYEHFQLQVADTPPYFIHKFKKYIYHSSVAVSKFFKFVIIIANNLVHISW